MGACLCLSEISEDLRDGERGGGRREKKGEGKKTGKKKTRSN